MKWKSISDGEKGLSFGMFVLPVEGPSCMWLSPAKKHSPVLWTGHDVSRLGVQDHFSWFDTERVFLSRPRTRTGSWTYGTLTWGKCPGHSWTAEYESTDEDAGERKPSQFVNGRGCWGSQPCLKASSFTNVCINWIRPTKASDDEASWVFKVLPSRTNWASNSAWSCALQEKSTYQATATSRKSVCPVDVPETVLCCIIAENKVRVFRRKRRNWH